MTIKEEVLYGTEWDYSEIKEEVSDAIDLTHKKDIEWFEGSIKELKKGLGFGIREDTDILLFLHIKEEINKLSRKLLEEQKGK